MEISKKLIVITIIILLLMLISPILINLLMFVSPMNWFAPKGVAIDNQWIGFFASYLGGIFGGIISGSLTLGGVYLTIKHQNKLLTQEKFEKVAYICGKLDTKFWSLNQCFKNEELSDAEKVEIIQNSATNFLKIINENNKYIMETNFWFINRIESVTRQLTNITTYFDDKDFTGRTNQQILKDFCVINNFIQIQFESIQKYQQKK